jgi:hypothetical protein
MQMLAMVATVGERRPKAALATAEREGGDPKVMIPGCCHLALPNTPCPYVGHPSNYTCPSGYYRQWWYCTEGSQRRACAECTKSSTTCWQGPFICSIWWWA